MNIPKKSLGQNFLIDKKILKLIISLTSIEGKSILEIGPGTGSEGHKSNEKLINKDLIEYLLLLENFLLKF